MVKLPCLAWNPATDTGVTPSFSWYLPPFALHTAADDVGEILHGLLNRWRLSVSDIGAINGSVLALVVLPSGLDDVTMVTAIQGS